MEHKTVTVAERDLVSLAKIVHAPHDQSVSWRECVCASCRKIREILPENFAPGENWIVVQLEA